MSKNIYLRGKTWWGRVTIRGPTTGSRLRQLLAQKLSADVSAG